MPKHTALSAPAFSFTFATMRFFAGLLSLYFILLAFVPCMDEVAHDHEAPVETTVVTLAMDGCSNHTHDEGDFCSPLCFCHCCHTHISLAQLNTVMAHQSATPAQHIDPIYTRGIQLVVGVFHPPQT